MCPQVNYVKYLNNIKKITFASVFVRNKKAHLKTANKLSLYLTAVGGGSGSFSCKVTVMKLMSPTALHTVTLLLFSASLMSKPPICNKTELHKDAPWM